MVKVLIKKVGEAARIEDIGSERKDDITLRAAQKAVGGYVEVVNRVDGAIIMVDEEGIPKNKPLNVQLVVCSKTKCVLGVNLCGTILVLGCKSTGTWTGLTKAQQKQWLKTMEESR